MSSNHGTYAQRRRDAALRKKARPTSQSALTFLKCRDGKWLTTSNAEVPFWENFCRLIGREGYIPLHRESGPEVDAMVEDIRAIFLTRDRDDWLRDLWAADTCAAPVNEPAEALDDPQVRHVGMTWEVEHPSQGPGTPGRLPDRLLALQGGPAPLRPRPRRTHPRATHRGRLRRRRGRGDGARRRREVLAPGGGVSRGGRGRLLVCRRPMARAQSSS